MEVEEEKRTKLEERQRGLPWVEKYRPASMDDLLGHEDITRTIIHLIDSGTMPHLLLYGPPGTGKTSTILAAARKLYGTTFSTMVLELNASDERGIDVVRNQIKDFAGSRMWQKGLKLVILDEADAMTNVAQGALRRIIEQYSKGTRFCLICNHINKIIPAIQSRCTRFRFAPLEAAAVRQCIARVSAAEGFTVTPDGVEALVRIGRGDMRRVLNVLQSTWLAYDVITKESIYEATGQPAPEDITRILEFMGSMSLKDAVAKIEEFKVAKGLALQDIIAELLPYVLLMKIDKTARMHIVSKLADVEANIAAGSSEKIQLGALVSAFQVLRLSC